MPPDRYQPLLQLIHGRAGDSFRAAIWYDADEWVVLYVRDDVATEQLRDSIPKVADRVRAAEPLIPEEMYDRLGDTQAVVELHDTAVLLHFRETQTQGIMVSLDRDVAQGLGQFVNSCNTVLEDERESDGGVD